jgi:hypothetical protein
METSYKSGTYRYVKYLRNGGTREVTALLNQQKRVRKGKTERDKANLKRTKVA